MLDASKNFKHVAPKACGRAEQSPTPASQSSTSQMEPFESLLGSKLLDPYYFKPHELRLPPKISIGNSKGSFLFDLCWCISHGTYETNILLHSLSLSPKSLVSLSFDLLRRSALAILICVFTSARRCFTGRAKCAQSHSCWLLQRPVYLRQNLDARSICSRSWWLGLHAETTSRFRSVFLQTLT